MKNLLRFYSFLYFVYVVALFSFCFYKEENPMSYFMVGSAIYWLNILLIILFKNKQKF